MADLSVFVDPDSGDPDYPPCNTGVELYMSVAPGSKVKATATRVIAQGDAPDRVAIHGGILPGFTLFKESHNKPDPSGYLSRLKLNVPFPAGSAPVSVWVTSKMNGAVSLIVVDPA